MYPLIFGFRDVVAGRGFLAGVQVEGFALLEQEDGAWWMTGVQPAGIADYGATEAEAYAEFRETFRNVLFDSAALATDFEAFKADIETICGQSEPKALQQWLDARAAIRGGASPSGDYVAGLSRDTRDDVVPRLRVVRLDRERSESFSPQQNKADRVLAAA